MVVAKAARPAPGGEVVVPGGFAARPGRCLVEGAVAEHATSEEGDGEGDREGDFRLAIDPPHRPADMPEKILATLGVQPPGTYTT